MLRVIILSAFLLLTGCSTYVRTDNLPISSTQSEASIKNAIQKAAKELDWKVLPNDNSTPANSHLLELLVRHHYLKVKITKEANELVISYVDSKNMKYNQLKNTIHKKYYTWVRNLKLKINLYLND